MLPREEGERGWAVRAVQAAGQRLQAGPPVFRARGVVVDGLGEKSLRRHGVSVVTHLQYLRMPRTDNT